MTNVLVTGASGALASYVIPRLVAAGYEVTGFDVAPPERLTDPAVRFVQGDLTSLERCLCALAYSEAEIVVHLGALPGPREMVRRPNWRTRQVAPEDITMASNTMGTYYLLDAVRRLGKAKTVVFASSFYTLGLGNRISDRPFEVEYLPIDEDHPLRPEDSYGTSKLLGEELLRAWVRAYKGRAVALRLMGIDYPFRNPDHYGEVPESDPTHVGGPVYTTFQYVDARDVAEAVILSIETPGLDEFEAFYITTDTIYQENTADLAARVWPDIAEMAGAIEGTAGIITDAKARRKLGYTPQYSWRNA
ncbi:MAG: NAD(P)-dependent oxidoreductase [Bifidobacteriaceae bacterium]|jgi:nucleoside-diphosphate-sugar epimerase|nr:NAD(P)-dependent oxidoreductase [Bifidobacteriaceae bacterium]